jgi:hypothetical protein
MSEFYNKYRRLFTEGETIKNNKSAFVELQNNFKSPSANLYKDLSSTPYRDEKEKRYKKLGRSPALD